MFKVIIHGSDYPNMLSSDQKNEIINIHMFLKKTISSENIEKNKLSK